ncbi:MAG: PIN domain-containing protein, partial [Nanoarchaeota archaeon]
MNIILDSNILFAVLIKDGKTADILVNPFLKLNAPEILFEEFSKYYEEIINKSHRNKEEFISTLSYIKELITIFSNSTFYEFIDEAEKISPDPDDIMYFALAIKLDCPIWSNDKK